MAGANDRFRGGGQELRTPSGPRRKFRRRREWGLRDITPEGGRGSLWDPLPLFCSRSSIRLANIPAILQLQTFEEIAQHLIVALPVVIVARRPEKRA